MGDEYQDKYFVPVEKLPPTIAGDILRAVTFPREDVPQAYESEIIFQLATAPEKYRKMTPAPGVDMWYPTGQVDVLYLPDALALWAITSQYRRCSSPSFMKHRLTLQFRLLRKYRDDRRDI